MSNTEVQEHRACDSFDLDGQWVVPCSCGRRFTSNTPSLARGRWKKHADEMAPSSGPTETPQPRAKVCGCGCGQPLAARANGLFCSGHDARFKSVLTDAHTAGQQVRHPLTAEMSDALDVADWLDARRGAGTFWHDKVVAGRRPQPERKPRPAAAQPTGQLRGVARVDRLMEQLAARRPTSGDLGTVTLRSGQTYGARVISRQGDGALALRLLDGPARGTDIVTGDDRFSKASR